MCLQSDMKIWKLLKNNLYILKYIWKNHRIQFFIRFFVLITNGLLPTATVIIIRKIMLNTETTQDIATVVPMITIFIVIQLIPNIIFSWHYNLNNRQFEYKLNADINLRFFDKVSELEFFDYENPDFYDTYSRALKEIDTRAMMVFNNVMDFFSQIISIVSVVIVGMSIKPVIILLCLISVIINIIFESICNSIEYNNEYKLTNIKRKIEYIKRVIYQPEYTVGIHLQPNLLKLFIRKFSESIEGIREKYMQVDSQKSILLSIKELLNGIINFSTIFIMCASVIDKEMLIIDFMSMQSLINTFTLKLKQLFTTITNFYFNGLYIDNLKRLLLWGKDSKRNIIINEDILKISFENFSFKYNHQKEYLIKNLNITINKGDKILILGKNGAGKSTLLKSILNFFPQTTGNIYINNIDIQDIKTQAYIQHFGVLIQNEPMYSISIVEYIYNGQYTEKKKTQLYDILKIVRLDNLISQLPNGINTILTTEFDRYGVELSSGEKQRLQLARVLASDAEVLVLDEPFSNLNKEMGNEIIRDVLKSYSEKTILMISHDNNMIHHFDKLICFSDNNDINLISY